MFGKALKDQTGLNIKERQLRNIGVLIAGGQVKKNLTPNYILSNLGIAIGLILIWRGVWYVLDEIDKLLFGGSHMLTGILGIVIGLLVLYLPDRDLKELERL